MTEMPNLEKHDLFDQSETKFVHVTPHDIIIIQTSTIRLLRLTTSSIDEALPPEAYNTSWISFFNRLAVTSCSPSVVKLACEAEQRCYWLRWAQSVVSYCRKGLLWWMMMLGSLSTRIWTEWTKSVSSTKLFIGAPFRGDNMVLQRFQHSFMITSRIWLLFILSKRFRAWCLSSSITPHSWLYACLCKKAPHYEQLDPMPLIDFS